MPHDQVSMSARGKYEAGLDTGWSLQRDGVYGPDENPAAPYWAGVRAGRAAWLRCVFSAMIVDRDPIPIPNEASPI